MDCSPLGPSIHGVSLGKNTGVDCHALPLQGTFPGIKPRSPTLQVDSLPSEPPGSGYPIPSSADLPNPGIEPGSPALQADSLPAEPPRKPKYTGVGSLSLLQQIFPTQELDWGLLNYRQILYQLGYKGSNNDRKHLKSLF